MLDEPHPLDFPFAQQEEQELAWLLDKIAGAKSILEIGSCFGHTLREFARVCPGAKISVIDIGSLPPEAGRYFGYNVAPRLREVIGDLSRTHDADLFIGNSHSPGAVEWAKYRGPFDFIFIDGDHTYEGAKLDWENYGPMGKLVAFHDIVYPHCGVSILWNEIKITHKTTQRIVAHNGIGVVECW